MRYFSPAKKISLPYSFDDSVRWIHRSGAEKLSHAYFRGSFHLEKIPEKAVMLAMSAHYSEIYINGVLTAELSERSYIFDKVYEVYDVTPYLKAGKNVVALADIDTGEPVRAGFALEILGDEILLASDGSWRCLADTSVNVGANYYVSAAEEKIDAERMIPNFAEADFDDAAWEMCEVIGTELLHAPYDRFHQSMTRAQTMDVVYPAGISALLTARSPVGPAFRLGPSDRDVTCAMATLSIDEEATLEFVTRGGVRGISVDGISVSQNQPFTVSCGNHFLTVAFSGTADIRIKTEGALSLRSPVDDEAAFAGYRIPLVPVRYPWNEFHGNDPTEGRVREILAASTFEALSDEVKSHLEPVNIGTPDSLVHEVLSRDLLLPSDGFVEERAMKNAPLPVPAAAGIADPENLLTECGRSVVLPQKDMLHFILDFGEEKVGRIEMSLDAPKGTVVEILAFEMIPDDGIRYMGDFQSLRYTCREGEQHFLSRRRRGFRYLSVFIYGNRREVSLDYIRVVETRYPAAVVGFTCSDETLCRIYDMSVRTAQVCMLDLYTDCPGYEQNAWTGDARVTGLVNLLNFGEFTFDAQYLRLIAESVEDGVRRVYRTNNPRYKAGLYLPCACFPTFPEGCIPIWSFMWFLQICDHYECTGDKQLLADVFYAVKETFARCEKMTNDRGLFDMQGAWNLIEWANNDLTFYGEVTANNAMLAYCLEKAADMAEILDDAALAAHYRTRARTLREAINRFCWDEEKRAYVDTARDAYAYDRYCAYMDERGMAKLSYDVFRSQSRISVQTNTMALLFDCVPEARQQDAVRFLLDNIRTGKYIAGTPAKRSYGAPSGEEAPDGYVHIGSPFFMYFALATLYKLGYGELALAAQRRDWGEFLRRGLATCIENFITGENFPRSAAHAWSASPAVFLISEVLGVKPSKPGYREFTVKPTAPGIDFAAGSVPTPYGPIRVEWKRLPDGGIDISCDAPSECKRVLP